MTKQDLIQCIDAVCNLPLPQQAVCVRLAAEAVQPVWQRWCKGRGIRDLSGALLTCFDRWLSGDATDAALNRIARKFHKALPGDLEAEPDASGGCAGWALRDIAMIALGQCKDVHPDILYTAIYYAAAAHCGSGAEAVGVKLDRLTKTELKFLKGWWERCRRLIPELGTGA